MGCGEKRGLSRWGGSASTLSSDLRPVPDNQEVFCHRVTDQSLIVELLELQAHVQGEEAAR